jgi:cell wall-associated NlpC family hydrolase
VNRFTKALGALVGVMLVLVSAQPAAADRIADKRAEARRLATKIEAEARRESILAEQLNEARLRVETLGSAVTRAQSDLEHTRAEVVSRRGLVRQVAVYDYMHGAAGKISTLLQGGRDLAIRQRYLNTIAGQQNEALDALHAATQDLSRRHAELDGAHHRAVDAAAAVARAEKAAAKASNESQATLRRVQGELATLVAAERERQAKANAARFRNGRRGGSGSSKPGRNERPTVSNVPVPPGAAGAVMEARRQIGKPYHYGAAGPGSFDCSGLTMWAWRAAGKSLPHSSRAQRSATTPIAISDLQPGDLLFYGSPVHHVGIAIGNGQMIHAWHSGTNVQIASIYVDRDLVGAGRVT